MAASYLSALRKRLSPGDVALALAVIAATTAGWWTFWFLTDDAYISFRYASNLLAGRGLVWNPPPFRPVEGFTSLLWTVGLAAIWEITGLQPPRTANWLSLCCGLGTLLLTVRLVRRLPWPGRSGRVVEAFTLVSTLTNRTFLAWLSSGLETALFDLEITGWISAALLGGPWPRWVAALSTWATLCALTRPDGMLLVAGTFAVVAVRAARERPKAWDLASLGLFSLIAVMLLWRRWTYGYWLPNTYYAKVPSPWPESGARYLVSFVLEYALVLPIAAATAWIGAMAVGRAARPRPEAALACGLLAALFSWYTFYVGGDHFEFRVYAWLVPLIPVAFGWAMAALRPGWLVPSLSAWLLLSWPIPWTHWALTRNMHDRLKTHMLVQPVAPYFPAFVGPIVEIWDEEQAWLIPHHVCMRHQEHRVFWEFLLQNTPPRSKGGAVTWDPAHPVRADGSCGLIGWSLPNVAIIDTFGLNDAVVAHNPERPGGLRLMAHDREPPPGYVECFRPNVELEPGHAFVVKERPRPLTEDDIRQCEEKFAPR